MEYRSLVSALIDALIIIFGSVGAVFIVAVIVVYIRAGCPF